MNPRRKSRLSLLLLALLGVSIAVGLMLYALRQNIDLFYTPTEVIYGKDHKSDTKPQPGQRLRIGGMVVEGTVVRDPNSLKVRFDLNDIGPSVTVEYEGILPDLFREGQGIVAQGVLIDEKTLKAHEVLAKHDENYVPPELESQMQKVHQPMGVSAADLKNVSEKDQQNMDKFQQHLQQTIDANKTEATK
ncbi:cytochrome c maturation protein CcmE [Testudinibacter aquarius]|uniref:Cytochrome c-type biogenesis protein CcmE n=1 Tax=Testudinibacter aquarius TaxID=1524974 RepID=A0A4R3XY77_9PAST|nr:cytochrome c maturation protein CcmE [Testudinibacter aquarius]KAE9529962.1 cytochrome c biogenesis protein CcmE [Testudinibacter aquarius]TCV83861.1 cytochrome c-type biogenesis protein CcmE [Testudinibacter aquarius]TNG89707.1 cytochrome c maturation protein CcmE [Testudinibacter aquarius]